MAFLAWDQSYSVGIEAIDAQHNVLFESLNDLNTAMLQGKTRDVTGALLRDVLAFTRKHFSAEESMLAKSGYPGLAEHQELHVELAAQIDEHVRRLQCGEPAISAQLPVFLRDRLTAHIRREDRAYGDWIAQHGVRRGVVLSAQDPERVSVPAR